MAVPVAAAVATGQGAVSGSRGSTASLLAAPSPVNLRDHLEQQLRQADFVVVRSRDARAGGDAAAVTEAEAAAAAAAGGSRAEPSGGQGGGQGGRLASELVARTDPATRFAAAA